MEMNPEEKKEDALKTLRRLLSDYKTASLATVDENGSPQVSYTPVAVEGPGQSLYLFVSELSAHTANLRRKGEASLLLMEDEQTSEQLFARNRLTLKGTVTPVERDSADWPKACLVYGARFGKFFELLVSLPDFHMFEFKANDARVVVGFGAAYQVTGPQWEELTLLSVK